jgi:hypothetical protein
MFQTKDGGAAFWDSVLSGCLGNLCADLIILTIAVAVINWIRSLWKRASAVISLEMVPTDQGTVWLRFVFENRGKLSFSAQEAYLRILLDDQLVIKEHRTIDAAAIYPVDIEYGLFPDYNGGFYSFQGYLTLPVFPDSQNEILAVRVVMKPGIKHQMRYNISSIHGRFPSYTWRQRLYRFWRRLIRRPLKDVSLFTYVPFGTEVSQTRHG